MEDRRRPICLRTDGDPVIGREGDEGIGARGFDIDVLEVSDGDRRSWIFVRALQEEGPRTI